MIDVDLRGRPVPGYIAVEGPVGVGKTTLAQRLAETFNHEMLLEDADENPFLERFYRNRREAALGRRIRGHRRADEQGLHRAHGRVPD